MADKPTQVISGQGAGGAGIVTGYRGSRADEAFGNSAEEDAKKKKEAADWAEYAKSVGMSPMQFSGLGGGAMRSQHKPKFDTWKAGKLKGASLGDLMTGAGG